MACKVYPEDGRCFHGTTRHFNQGRGVKRQLCASKSSNIVRLEFPSMVSCSQMHKKLVHDGISIDKSRGDFTNTFEELPSSVRDNSFVMSNMDEITYWIYTRRPPCLMKYDLAKKQNEPARCSKPKLCTSIQSISDETKSNTPKKKKRKLSILDDDSGSVKEQPNLYFDSSNPQKVHQIIESSKSDTVTDTDFNIKKSSVHDKLKKAKLQRNSRSTLHKKNKIFTSTPNKPTRRSNRNSGKSLNYSGALNYSFELLNAGPANNHTTRVTNTPIVAYVKPAERCKKIIEKIGLELGSPNGKINIVPEKQRVTLNGNLEDDSDVSGFTANYIRSTKNASKTTKNTKNKSKTTLKSPPQPRKTQKTVVCVNKSVNTGKINDDKSSESSQYCINLLTSEQKVKDHTVSRGTSVLKFIDPKNSKSKQRKGKACGDEANAEPTTSPRRYPKRNKSSNCTATPQKCDTTLNSTPTISPRKRNNKTTNDDTDTPIRKSRRTRSSKTLFSTSQTEKLATTTEHASSRGTVNVAAPQRSRTVKNKSPKKVLRQQRSVNKSERSTTGKDSIRDKSGFAACFSDSDDDKPLKPQKYFC